MSAVLTMDGAAARRSEGVWAAAWRRFKGDRVGLVSMVIVAGFALLMLAAAVGLVAGDWQKEVGALRRMGRVGQEVPDHRRRQARDPAFRR